MNTRRIGKKFVPILREQFGEVLFDGDPDFIGRARDAALFLHKLADNEGVRPSATRKPLGNGRRCSRGVLFIELFSRRGDASKAVAIVSNADGAGRRVGRVFEAFRFHVFLSKLRAGVADALGDLRGDATGFTDGRR